MGDFRFHPSSSWLHRPELLGPEPHERHREQALEQSQERTGLSSGARVDLPPVRLGQDYPVLVQIPPDLSSPWLALALGGRCWLETLCYSSTLCTSFPTSTLTCGLRCGILGQVLPETFLQVMAANFFAGHWWSPLLRLPASWFFTVSVWHCGLCSPRMFPWT